MASINPPITDYYEATFQSNGTGGAFQFTVQLRMKSVYNGDGTEFGPGVLAGQRQLTKVAKGMAKGFENAGAPTWNNITLVSLTGVQRHDAVLDTTDPTP